MPIIEYLCTSFIASVFQVYISSDSKLTKGFDKPNMLLPSAQTWPYFVRVCTATPCTLLTQSESIMQCLDIP